MAGKRAVSVNKVMKLSVSEKILVVEELWDSIAMHPESLPVTKSQKEELDKRLENYGKNSKKGSSWIEVKRRIQRRSHK